MTRERLVEIIRTHVNNTTEGDMAAVDAILAEMPAGEWNAACETIERACKDKYHWLHNVDDVHTHGKRLGLLDAAAIARALRRPDAAPVRPAPSVDEVAMNALRALSLESRMEVMRNFCGGCGFEDPACQCWNDE